jgi:hypothetical protein
MSLQDNARKQLKYAYIRRSNCLIEADLNMFAYDNNTDRLYWLAEQELERIQRLEKYLQIPDFDYDCDCDLCRKKINHTILEHNESRQNNLDDFYEEYG